MARGQTSEPPHSSLENAEVPADVRKQIVGHSSDQIHKRYVHLELALQAKAIANLPNLH